MLAKAFLEQLRAEQAPPPGRPPSRRALDLTTDRLRDALGDAYDPEVHQSVRSRIEAENDPIIAIEKNLLHPLAGFLTKTQSAAHRERLQDVAIGMLATADPNATAIRVPDGTGYIVVVDGGLFTTLMRLNEITVGLLESQSPRRSDPAEAAQDFYKVSGYYLQTITRPIPVERFQRNVNSMAFTTALTQAQLLFLIGHEFGHITYGHLDGTRSKRWALSTRTVELITPHHRQEFEADALGLGSAMTAVAAMPDDDLIAQNRWVVPFATCLFHLYLEMFESLGFVPPNTPSHPSAHSRLEALAVLLNKWLTDDNRSALSFVQQVCRSVRHPVPIIQPTPSSGTPSQTTVFYLCGEIIANKHSIGVLSLVFSHTYIYGLEDHGAPPHFVAAGEAVFRTDAEKIARGNPLFIEFFVRRLQGEGAEITFDDVVDAQAESLFNYNKQWWPFYEYVGPLSNGQNRAFAKLEFEDDPSEIANLPLTESVSLRTKQDLIYNWQLCRNHGILKVVRLAAVANDGILVSDTPIKLLQRWLPGPPSHKDGHYEGVILARLPLLAISTLTPAEAAAIRQAVMAEVRRASSAFGRFNTEVRALVSIMDSGELVRCLRHEVAAAIDALHEPLKRIEAAVQRYAPDRAAVQSYATLLLGPLASSPILPSPAPGSLMDIGDIDQLDTSWFRYVLKTCCLSVVLEYDDRKEWPRDERVESPYWNE